MQIHHVAMRTAHVSRLEEFYTVVLGLCVLKRDPTRRSVWLRAGDAVIMLEPVSEGEPLPRERSMELLAFAAQEPDGLERWRSRLAAAGVPVEGSTANTIYFRDPDGRRVAVSDYRFP